MQTWNIIVITSLLNLHILIITITKKKHSNSSNYLSLISQLPNSLIPQLICKSITYTLIQMSTYVSNYTPACNVLYISKYSHEPFVCKQSSLLGAAAIHRWPMFTFAISLTISIAIVVLQSMYFVTIVA